MTTADSNLAAFLVYRGLPFSYHSEEGNGRDRVFFTFATLSDAEANTLTLEFLNGDFQRFCDAQRRIKNVIRNLAR